MFMFNSFSNEQNQPVEKCLKVIRNMYVQASI